MAQITKDIDLMSKVEFYANKVHRKYIGAHIHVVTDLLETVVENLGIVVVRYRIEEDNESKVYGGIFTHRNPKINPKIFLNTKYNQRTQNFTLAHELSHYLLQKEMSSMYDIDLTDLKIRERTGDFFAAALLLNSEAVTNYFDFFNKAGKSLYEIIFRIADIFKVPYISVIRRFIELEIIPANKETELLAHDEQSLMEIRNQLLGPSSLDGSPFETNFAQYIDLVDEKVKERKLSALDAAKKINSLDSAKAEIYFANSEEIQKKILEAMMDDDADD